MRTDRGWVSVLAMVFMIVLQATVGLAADLTSNDPRTMRFPTVEFNPPDAERVVLENGMVVYLLEDHELPLVTINATLRTGSWARGWPNWSSASLPSQRPGNSPQRSI